MANIGNSNSNIVAVLQDVFNKIIAMTNSEIRSRSYTLVKENAIVINFLFFLMQIQGPS